MSRSSLVRIAGLILLGTVLGRKPEPPPLEVTDRSVEDTHGPVPAVLQSASVLFRRTENGLPRLSPAGFVQLEDSGPGFFYVDRLPEREAAARATGRLDTNNWGDADSFRMLARVIARRMAAEPGLPRLGIEDISSPFGGFFDYDKDGEADHRTHQLGSNINIFLPCKGTPEVEVDLGGKNRERYDAEAAQRLAELLYEEGAWSITTTSATNLLATPRAFRFPSAPGTATETGTQVMKIGERQSLILMKEADNHGNVFNVRLTPSF